MVQEKDIARGSLPTPNGDRNLSTCRCRGRGRRGWSGLVRLNGLTMEKAVADYMYDPWEGLSEA